MVVFHWHLSDCCCCFVVLFPTTLSHYFGTRVGQYFYCWWWWWWWWRWWCISIACNVDDVCAERKIRWNDEMERETKRKMLFLLSLPAESARQSYSVHWLPLNPKQCSSDTFVRQMHLSCDKKCQMRRRRLWFADSSLSHLGKVSSSSCLSRCCCSIKLTDYCALSESIAPPIDWLTDCCCCTFCPPLLALFLWTWPTWLHFLFFLRLFLSLLLFWVLLPRADWLIGNGNQHLRGFGEQWHSGTSLYWFSTLLFSFFLGFSPLSFFLFMLCVCVREGHRWD